MMHYRRLRGAIACVAVASACAQQESAERRVTDIDGEVYEVPNEVVASIDEAYADLVAFLDNLPAAEDSMFRLTHEHDDVVWDSVLAPSAGSLLSGSLGYISTAMVLSVDSASGQAQWIPSPDIGPMLSSPLVVNNLRIRELFNSRRVKPKAWAGVYCHGGELVVGYAADSIAARARGLKNLNPYGFVFVRYHELGHILLDHVWCDSSGNTRRLPEDPKLELAADCKAAELLVAQYRDGVRIVDNVHGQFDQKGGGGGRGHPPFSERASNLYTVSCGAS